MRNGKVQAMGYPGDQGKPGGWPPGQSPPAPYGPGGGTPEASPYGTDHDEAPFAPRAEGDSSGTGPLGEFGGTVDPAAWADEPGDAQSFAAPSFEAQTYQAPPDDALHAPERRRNLPLIIGGAVVAGLVLIGGGVGLSSMLEVDPKPKGAAPAPSAPPAQATVT